MAAVVVGLFLAIMGALSMPAAGANAFDAASQSAAYDCQANYATPTHAGAERAPPATYERGTSYDAVDRWSRGASACPEWQAPSSITTYDGSQRPVPLAHAAGTTREQGLRPRRGPPLQ